MNTTPVTQPIPKVRFIPPTCPQLTDDQSKFRDRVRTKAIVEDSAETVVMTIRGQELLRSMLRVWIKNRFAANERMSMNKLVTDILYQTMLSNLTDEEIKTAYKQAYPDWQLP